MERLYAVGETACNGVHGKNRLASNSLLETLVFASRAAKHLTSDYKKSEEIIPTINEEEYTEYEIKYKNAVLSAIEKEKKKNG